MAGLSTGQKTLLSIAPCSLDKKTGNISVVDPKNAQKEWFEVMINPSDYSHKYTVDTEVKKRPIGGTRYAKFNAYRPDSVNFDIVVDGTGVVELPKSALASKDVKTQIQKLKDVVYVYDGAEHSPHPVRVLWGSLIFFGMLESMSMQYTLFKPSGEPLRAKVGLAFKNSQSVGEWIAKAKPSSPDMDHVLEVKAGDTLPLLCYQVYKDSGYYTDIARVNNLVNFRTLTPGTRLRFPPLR
ncbi:MAG: peptidoglycan-binding protein [Chloroflexi bacterium]|nr:peptidoglycan-binding protein [Chloroflexota bacterium]